MIQGLTWYWAYLSVLLDVGGEATLVTDVAGILAVLLLDDALEVVVHLHTLDAWFRA